RPVHPHGRPDHREGARGGGGWRVPFGGTRDRRCRAQGLRRGAADVIRAYRSLFVMEARRLFAYRLGAIVGWVGGGAYLISALAVWHALLEQGSIGGYDWTTMKGYLLVAWATGAIGSAS